MYLPDEIKNQVLDASVGGIEAFLTCVGCCVVALHPKGRYDKVMREYCLSSEFFEEFIEHWGKRWSRAPSRRRRSSHPPQPRPAPKATPSTSRHKKNGSSGGVLPFPSPQSSERETVNSSFSYSAGSDSWSGNQSQASTPYAPSPAGGHLPMTSFPTPPGVSQEDTSDNFTQPSAVDDDWNTFLGSLLDAPQVHNGYPDRGFSLNDIGTNVLTSTVSNDTLNMLPATLEDRMKQRPEIIERTITPITTQTKLLSETFRITNGQRQAGPSSKAEGDGALDLGIFQDSLVRSIPDDIPTITAVTPNGSNYRPMIYPFDGTDQRLSGSVSSQRTAQNSSIRPIGRVSGSQNQTSYVRGNPSSTRGKRERPQELEIAAQIDTKERCKTFRRMAKERKDP